MNAPSLVRKLCRVLSNSYSGNLPAISWIPWITDKILEAVFQKAAPRLAKDTKEWRRLCSGVRVKTKGDRERYMYQIGSDAEEDLSNNQLKGAFRAITEISGKAPSTRTMVSHVPLRRRPSPACKVARAPYDDVKPSTCNGPPGPQPECSLGQ